MLKQAEEREEAASLNDSEPDSEDDQDDDDNERAPTLSREQRAELLRRQVDTVGQPGKPGANIQHVISVGMLSEGWDAKTVTHIMGLRAFSSQLLCEQVVGRGLRRTSYETNPETGLFEPEYVNIFGVPFTFLPHEGGDGPAPPPPSPKTRVEPVPEKQRYELSFPNIVRIEHTFRQRLALDWSNLKRLELNAAEAITEAELAPMLEGKPNLASLSEIELRQLEGKLRMQRIVFQTAVNVYDQMRPDWKGAKEVLLAQVIALVDEFIRSGAIAFLPPLFNQDDLRRRMFLTVSMNKIVQHIWHAISLHNSEALEPVFDDSHPIRSTADIRPWYTGRSCEFTKRSHVNFCVFDSTWEATEAYELDRNPQVAAWVKNDHLGLEIPYIFGGVRKKYRPDFLIRLVDGRMLVLEVKGQNVEEAKVKRDYLGEWIGAINAHGGFGIWSSAVSYNPKDVAEILHQLLPSMTSS